MSYDIEVFTRKMHYDGNYTSNVAPMYAKAYKRAQEIEQNLLDSGELGPNSYKRLTYGHFTDCFDGSEFERVTALRALRYMTWAMKEEPEEYKKLNPENGWGNYEGALEFLERAYKALQENEYAVIQIDY